MSRRLLAVLVLMAVVTIGCTRKEAPGSAGIAVQDEAVSAAPPPAVASGPMRVGGSGEGFVAPSAQAPAPESPTRKLMRDARVLLEVKSVEEALRRLRDLTLQSKGYVSGESRFRDRRQGNAGSIECRIPADALDSLTKSLASLGTVLHLSVSAADITEDYADLEIRLRNQKALETRLLELLRRPTNKLPDLLEAERELARVRGEIDQMEGRRRFWDNRVALAVVRIDVREPGPTVGSGRGGAWSLLRDAFGDAAENFVSAIAGIIAVSGGLIPIVVAIGLVLWVLLRLWKRRRARRQP